MELDPPRAVTLAFAALAAGALVALLRADWISAGLLLVAGAAVVVVSRAAARAAAQAAARTEAEAALRQAVQAQWLERQALPTDEPGRVRTFHHDLNNTLQGALLAADGLKGALKPPGHPALVAELADELADELHRASRMARDFRPAQPRALARVRVAIGEVAQARVAQCRARFGAVALEHTPVAAIELELVGGEETLQRVLDALLANACEGDGQRVARAVRLEVESTADVLRLRILDDGPGFPPDRLPAPAEPLWTTKPQHIGLGLCTAEMLVRANGGALVRTNRPEGGACVTVELPRRRAAG